MFTSLRQLCKTLRDDSELEIEFIKYHSTNKFDVDLNDRKKVKMINEALKFLCNRLIMYLDDVPQSVVLGYASVINSLLPPITAQFEIFSRNHPVFQLMKVLVGRENFVDIADNLPIRYFCNAGDTAAVKQLLKNPLVDPGANKDHAIFLACFSNHIEIVRVLLKDPRVDPEGDDNRPMRIACLHNHRDIALLLMQDGRADCGELFGSSVFDTSPRMFGNTRRGRVFPNM